MNINNRRGLSTIVGSLLFTFLMIGGFTVMSLALETQSDIVSTQRIVSDSSLKKQQEDFVVTASTDDNDLLEIFVLNSGQNPVEVSGFWIINKTMLDQPAKRFDVPYDSSFILGGEASELTESLSLTMNPGEYDIKVVSSLGTIKEAELDYEGYFRVEMFVAPTDIGLGRNATIGMLVTNNAGVPLTSVSPGMENPDTDKPAMVNAMSLTSASSVDLEPDETAIFLWDANFNGADGTEMTFNNFVTGIMDGEEINSQNVTDSGTLRLHFSEGETSEKIILTDELLARPGIFLVIPSPFGDSGDKGLWGVNIVNPTNTIMNVSKVTIAAFVPGANSNDKVFDVTNPDDCIAEDIYPSGYDDWSCPSENIVLWKNQTHPIEVDPFSVEPFLVKALPGAISGSQTDARETVIVQSTVFTTSGSFGKAGYQTTMKNGGEVIASIYFGKQANSTNNSDMEIVRNNLTSLQEHTFNVTLADLDTDPDTYMQPGTKFIINVPRDWGYPEIISHGGFDEPVIIPFGDDSHQIFLESLTNIGDNINNAYTVQFNSTAPEAFSDEMDVMYVLADGTTENGFSIGPLAELLLHITP